MEIIEKYLYISDEKTKKHLTWSCVGNPKEGDNICND